MATDDLIPFSYPDWIAGYPNFVTVPPAQGQVYWDLAGSLTPNGACNPLYAAGLLPQALYLLTSHIAWLMMPRAGQAAGGVGRIASASEGSVSVSFDWAGSGTPNESWFLQTQYGALYWMMTSGFRTAHYVPRPTIAPLRGPARRWGYPNTW